MDLSIKEVARMGGKAKMAKYGRNVFVEMGKKSGEKRRKVKEEKTPETPELDQ